MMQFTTGVLGKRGRDEFCSDAGVKRSRQMPEMAAANGVVKPGVMVRVLPCSEMVHALHQYPFFGANPCPAARCGWDCMAVETGVGDWRQGVKVRFADGNEWCYNPRALVCR